MGSVLENKLMNMGAIELKTIKMILSITVLLCLILTGCSSSNKNTEPIKNNIESSTISDTSEPPETRSSPTKLNSGLLLGLRADVTKNGKTESSYRTLWIAPENSQVKLKSEGDFILVPHGSGFWKIENVRYNGDIQYLMPYPAGTQPKYTIFKSREQAQDSENITTSAEMKLMFVGNKYVSYTYDVYNYTVGTPHGTMTRSMQVSEIQNIKLDGGSYPIEQLLGADSLPIAEETRSTIDAQYDTELGIFETETSTVMWGISRSKGKFAPLVCRERQTRSQAMDYVAKELPVILPKSIVTYDELTPGWEEIKKTLPDVVDAVSSPEKDMFAAVTPSKLLIYSIVDGKVGSSMLDIGIKDNESIIMAQWATGSYVEKWTQEVEKYLTNMTNSTSGNSQQVPDNFYGEWEVTRCLAFPEVSEFNSENVKAYYGRRIKFAPGLLDSNGQVCKDPVYRLSTISEVDFRVSYKGFFKDLGVNGDSLQRIQIYPNETSKLLWEGVGNTIFIKDKETLILWNGVFLEMKRVR
ncbi:MAG: hypothetical protein BWY74_00739 [Firmicutes bacterium ADurb.Bin419]|nr:MAG: hypothetical protein BWY74_00739 [Firmicutes bacterium ADurb.Bin419]